MHSCATRSFSWHCGSRCDFNTKFHRAPDYDRNVGTELYDHTTADTVENVAESANVVADPALASTVAALSKQLHAGWRAARKGQHEI